MSDVGISQGFANYLVAEALVYDSVGADPRCWVTPDLGTTWSYRGNIFNTPLTDENYSLECAHVPGRGTNPLTDVWLHFIYCDYDFGGWLMYQGKNISLVSIAEETEKDLSNFNLRTEPNPFTTRTTLTYNLPRTDNVGIKVYNILGETVTTLYNGVQQNGIRHLTWNGTDDRGNRLPKGTYFIHFNTSFDSQVKKVLLVR